MPRKFFVLLSSLALASLVLSACGGAPAEPASPPAPAATTQPAKGEEPAEGSATATSPQADAPQSEATQTAPAEQASGDAGLVADLGFRPQANGFSFPNYGGDQQVTNLTPVEFRRMFGDRVCARIEGEECTLTPVAQQQMEQLNASMSGGHCEGFAVLSLLMYSGKIDPAQFGGSNASELQLQGNEMLQREIAYWFSTQYFRPTRSELLRAAPKDIVAKLQEGYKTNSGETYAVGIYQPGYKAGHAVTAYAVQDKGNGVFWIMVYDNNYPGQERYIEVDTNADTWQYEASINPSVQSELYKGDASTLTLEIVPTSARTQPQVCEFCESSAPGKGGMALAQAADRTNDVWMEGDARLLITDAAGHKLGYEGDKFVNEIPKATVDFIKGANLNEEDVPPVFHLPVGMQFSAVLDGDSLKNKDDATELAMIGPGYYIGVQGILMDPGEKDYLTFGGDGKSISYKTDYEETPTIIVGVERPQADYELELTGNQVKAGSETKVEFDPEKGTMTFYSTSDEPTKFSILISRIDDKETETFEGDALELGPKDKIILDYGVWDGQGKSLKVHYDQGGDGTIDETVDMADGK
jgi:hypothetical protein